MKQKLKDFVRGRLSFILDNVDICPEEFEFDGICNIATQRFWLVELDDPRINNQISFNEQITVRNWLTAQFQKWPEYSGDRLYPVPPPPNVIEEIVESNDDLEGDEFTEVLAYAPDHAFEQKPLWEGEYGESRIRLVMFLLQQLER